MKILWAIDAFDDLTEIRKKEIQFLRQISQRTSLEIIPTYVLSASETDRDGDTDLIQRSDHFLPAAKRAVAQIVSEADIPGLGTPEVLSHTFPTQRESVRRLALFAKEQKFDLIIAGSHGRRGLQRMVLGSFAEDLLLQSEVPVMVFGGNCEAIMELKPNQLLPILLPNHLKHSHADIYPEIFRFANQLSAKINFLQVKPRLIEPAIQSGVYLLSGAMPSTSLHWDATSENNSPLVTTLRKQAEAANVPCQFNLDDTATSVTDSILKTASGSRASLILMIAESNSITTTLLGSITRQIVRHAPCPVIVFRKKGYHA